MIFFKNPNNIIKSVTLESFIDHYKKNNPNSDFTKEKIIYSIIDFYFFKSAFIVIISFLKNLFNIFNQKPFYIFDVELINFGKYITAYTLRNVETNKNSILFFYNFTKNLISSIFVYAAALRISKKASAVCLASDPGYLDGIIIDFFLKKKNIKVYFKIDTFDLVCVFKNYYNINDFRYKNIRQDHIKMQNQKIINYMNNRLMDPAKNIFYYDAVNTKNKFIKKNTNKIDFIIYQHSFTDVQLDFGFDGFKSVYDWLLFTIDHINKNSKNNIYLKVHPNMYAQNWKSNVIEMDKKIWFFLKQKLPSSVNLIETTLSNYKLLRTFNPKNTILISHHGNAIVEGAYLGFKSISSYNSLWSDNYSFSNLWKNKKEYLTLLNHSILNLEYLKQPDETLNLFIKDCYLREFGSYSEKSFPEIISKLSNIQIKEIVRNPDFKIPLVIKQKIINEISNNLQSF